VIGGHLQSNGLQSKLLAPVPPCNPLHLETAWRKIIRILAGISWYGTGED
jgi:hypothetical protein